jgi:hypothetical protein
MSSSFTFSFKMLDILYILENNDELDLNFPVCLFQAFSRQGEERVFMFPRLVNVMEEYVPTHQSIIFFGEI